MSTEIRINYNFHRTSLTTTTMYQCIKFNLITKNALDEEFSIVILQLLSSLLIIHFFTGFIDYTSLVKQVKYGKIPEN